MKKFLWYIIFFAFLVALGYQQPLTDSLVLKNVTIIDATGSPAKLGMTVVISGNRIAIINKAGEVKMPKGAQVLDASKKFLIPGLWDMHVHFFVGGESSLPLFMANGVTSVRDMGGDFRQIQELRTRIREGKLLGPRIKTPGPMIESTRWLTMVEKLLNKEKLKLSNRSLVSTRIGVDKPENAAQTIESMAAMGVDFLKIRSCSSKKTFFAMADAAKRVGLPLVGHNTMVVSLKEASEAGQRSFEHNFFPSLEKLSDEDKKELIACLLRNGTAFVPTMVVDRLRMESPEQITAEIEDTLGKLDFRRRYISKELVDFWREQQQLEKYNSPMNWEKLFNHGYEFFRTAHRAGVKIMAGTDFHAPLIYPGFSLHDELHNMVEKIGMTPMEALQSATRVGAEFMGLDDSLGTIEQGKIADLVLLNENPLEDITNTKKISAVVVDGKLFDSQTIKDMLEKVEKSTRKE